MQLIGRKPFFASSHEESDGCVVLRLRQVLDEESAVVV